MVYYCVTHAHSCIHTYTPIHTPTHTHTHSPKHTHVQMLHSSSIDTKTTLRTPTPTLHTHSIHSQAPHTPTKHPTYVYCVYNYISSMRAKGARKCWGSKCGSKNPLIIIYFGDQWKKRVLRHIIITTGCFVRQ